MAQHTSEASAKAGPGVLLGGEHLLHSKNGASPQRVALNIPPIIRRHWWREEPSDASTFKAAEHPLFGRLGAAVDPGGQLSQGGAQ